MAGKTFKLATLAEAYEYQSFLGLANDPSEVVRHSLDSVAYFLNTRTGELLTPGSEHRVGGSKKLPSRG